MKSANFLIVLLLSSVNHSAAAPAKDAQGEEEAILNKAMEALGGENKLTKLNTFVVKSREKTTVSGVESQSIESITSHEFPDKMREEYKAQAPRLKGALAGVRVFNGEHAWTFTNGRTTELSNEHIADFHRNLFVNFPVRWLPLLKGKEYKLTVLGDAKVEERRATVIMASREADVDVKLFFDKDDGLLLKKEFVYTLSDDGSLKRASADDPKAIKVEIFYENYKESGGIKYPSRSTWVEREETRVGEITEFKVVEKFDEKSFAKPE